MDFIAKIKGCLRGHRRLDKVTLEELRMERIRLEQIEQRIAQDVEHLEARKQQLFLRGKDEPSSRQQIGIARGIKELDVSAQAKDRQLALLGRQMRVVGGLMSLKENQALVGELGVSGILSRMDLQQLQKYVERALVQGQFQMERFARMLKAMEAPDEFASAEPEDADTLAIVAAMQEAGKSHAADDERAVRSGMEKVNDILRARQVAQAASAEGE